MKKQYISPLCNVVAMEMDSCILAASDPANKISLAGNTAEDIEQNDDEDMWVGSKSSVFDLDD